MDFSAILQQTKEELGIEEIIKTEEEIQFEDEEDAYNTNIHCEEEHINHLDSIIYPPGITDMFDPKQRATLDEQYKHVTFTSNTINRIGTVTAIKEFQITNILIFFRLNCTAIDMTILENQMCQKCHILCCRGDMCEDYKSTNKNDADKYRCAITVERDGFREVIPVKRGGQFGNQYSCYVQIDNKRIVPGYHNLIQIKKKRRTLFQPNTVKIFKDGSITVLGAKSFDHSLHVVRNILNELNRINKIYPSFISFEQKTDLKDTDKDNKSVIQTNPPLDPEPHPSTSGSKSKSDTIDLQDDTHIITKKKKLKKVRLYRRPDGSKEYNIHLLNATYYIDFRIDRAKFHKILINKYNILKCQCEFHPDNHSAVIIKFNWNLDNKYNGKFGLCSCTRPCVGKGSEATGQGNSHCKVISIKVFGSGSISFMGANKFEQLADCYHFINSILDMEYYNIRMKPKKIEPKRKTVKAPKKRITIKKHQIMNIDTYNTLKYKVH
jgi:hypothetical protein